MAQNVKVELQGQLSLLEEELHVAEAAHGEAEKEREMLSQQAFL